MKTVTVCRLKLCVLPPVHFYTTNSAAIFQDNELGKLPLNGLFCLSDLFLRACGGVLEQTMLENDFVSIYIVHHKRIDKRHYKAFIRLITHKSS